MKRRFFFSMERTRKSTVWVDGTCAGSFDSFYAAHRYELTRLLTPGRHTLVVMTDNTDYVSNGGHMTSPDTQTNWNGILGEIYLESVVDIAVDKMWIYPSRKNRSVDIRMVLSGCNTVSDKAWSDISADVSCRLTRLRMKAGRDFEHFEPLGTQTAETRREWILQGKGQDLPYCIETLEVFPEKRCAIRKDDACTGVGVCYEFEKPVKEWDEYNPYVYELTVKILRGGQLLCGQTSHFGFRDFSHRELGGLTNVTVQATWRLKKQAGAQADGREDAGLCEIVVQSVSCRDVSGRGLFTLGTLRLKVPECEKNAEYILRFTLTADNAEDIVNEYDIFIYEEAVAKVQDAHQSFAAGGAEASCDNVCVTNDNKTALDAWQNGKAVALFVRENSMLPDSTMKGEYCTDFWCYPIFRSISEGAGKPLPVGTMGLLIDSAHPALNGFACESYTTPQWYEIVMHSRPMILDNMAETKDIKPIVRMMDNFERNHNLGLIYEIKRACGKMLVCHADLLTLKDEYPEAACLYTSLVAYVCSEAF